MKKLVILLVAGISLASIVADARAPRHPKHNQRYQRYDRYEERHHQAESDYDLGKEAFQSEDYNLALKHFEKWVKRHGNDGYAWGYIAYIKAEKHDYKAALKANDRALKGDIRRDDAKFLNFIYFNRAEIFLGLRDKQSAIEALDKAASVMPGDAETINKRANLLSREGYYEEAEQDFKTLVELEPKNINGYMGLGYVYGKMNRPRKAIECYDKAVKIDKSSDKAFANRAVQHYNDNKFDKAAADAIRAIEINGQNSTARMVIDNLRKAEPQMIRKMLEKKARDTDDPTWLDL